MGRVGHGIDHYLLDNRNRTQKWDPSNSLGWVNLVIALSNNTRYVYSELGI